MTKERKTVLSPKVILPECIPSQIFCALLRRERSASSSLIESKTKFHVSFELFSPIVLGAQNRLLDSHEAGILEHDLSSGTIIALLYVMFFACERHLQNWLSLSVSILRFIPSNNQSKSILACALQSKSSLWRRLFIQLAIGWIYP